MPGLAISARDARGLFTKKCVDVFVQRLQPTTFLQSFFPSVQSPTLGVSIEVIREGEAIAVDVALGSTGNRNEWARSTEKIIEPIYYREYFDLTKFQLYEKLFSNEGDEMIAPEIFSAMINSVTDKNMSIKNKIVRAIERMCANIFMNGKITAISGGQHMEIDYGRQSWSIITAGTMWTDDTANPFSDIEGAAKLLRTKGLVGTSQFNYVMGNSVASAFTNNKKVKERQNMFNWNPDTLIAPQMNSQGASYMGKIMAGPYTVYLWSYPQYYKAKDGTVTPYIDEDKSFMVPLNPQFKCAYGAVPQVVTPGAGPIMGEFVFSDYRDIPNRSHRFDVESRPLPVPTAIDHIVTLKATA